MSFLLANKVSNHFVQKYTRLILTLFLLLFFFRCSKKDERPVIATVADRKISIEEFKLRYELTPHSEASSNPLERRYQFLASLVGEKLLAGYAEKHKWQTDRRYRARIDQLSKEALVETLFKEKLFPAVKITESEIRQALAKGYTRLDLHLWNFSSLQEAQAFARRLSNDPTLSSLQKPQTISVVWGQSDPRLEEIAYKLEPGKVSPPFYAAGQYHVLRLLKQEPIPPNPGLTEQEEKEKILETLRVRKESAAIDSLLRQLMQGNAMHISKKLFARVSRVIGASMQNANEPLIAADSSMNRLSERQVSYIRKNLADLLQEPLVRFEKGEQWTVADVIEKIAVGPFHLPPPSSSAFPIALRQAIRKAAELEAMARQAKRLGLDNSAYYKTQVGMWRDALLTQRTLQAINDTLVVSRQEIEYYYQQHKKDFTTPPLVNVYQLTVTDRKLADQARKRIAAGEDFLAVAKWAADKEGRAVNRIETGYITYGSLGPLARDVRSAKVGQLVGPLPFKAGKYVILKIIGKKDSGLYPLQNVYDEIKHKVRVDKLSRIYDTILTELLKDEKVSINQNALQNLKLSETGAVVIKRHFPGRMIAPISYPFYQSRNYYHHFKEIIKQ